MVVDLAEEKVDRDELASRARGRSVRRNVDEQPGRAVARNEVDAASERVAVEAVEREVDLGGDLARGQVDAYDVRVGERDELVAADELERADRAVAHAPD